MSRKRRPNKQFRENTSMTRAQKREAGLLVATGHPTHTGRKTTMDTRPRGQRDRHNARRVAIARAMD